MSFKRKKTWEEKRERVKKAMDDMNDAIEGYFTTPEQLKEYLEFMSKMYDYSPRNSALIHSQFPGAIAVGSYNFWKEKGFPVQKGERGVKIFVPNRSAERFKTEKGKWKNIKYATEEEKELIQEGKLEHKKSRLYFSIGHVFDVSQTNAKASDLPEIFPNRWLEGTVEDYNVLMDSFKGIADDLNVTVGDPLDELGSAKGAFYPAVDAEDSIGHIGLNPRNSELQNVKTIIHELAHAKLHSGDKGLKMTSEEREFQAEMVAYSVASYFNIDTSDYSLQYLANWTQGKEFEDKAKLLSEVKDASVEFITHIEKDLVLNNEREKNKKLVAEVNFVPENADEYTFADLALKNIESGHEENYTIWMDLEDSNGSKFIYALGEMEDEEINNLANGALDVGLDEVYEVMDFVEEIDIDEIFTLEQVEKLEALYNHNVGHDLYDVEEGIDAGDNTYVVAFNNNELKADIGKFIESEEKLKEKMIELEGHSKQDKEVEFSV